MARKNRKELEEIAAGVRTEFIKKFKNYLRSDPPFIWIRGTLIKEILEDVRKAIKEMIDKGDLKREVFYWTHLDIIDENSPFRGKRINAVLSDIIRFDYPIFVMEGANYFFSIGELVCLLRDIIENKATIIMCGGYGNLPQELEKHAIVIDYIQEYDPRRFELILLSIEKSRHRPKLAWIEEEENTVRDILKGCSTIEMEQGLSYAVVSSETKEEFINELLKFKKEILIKAGLIPIDIDECPSLDEVGGMDVLKRYILRSKAILDNHLKIKEMHNLPSPKGILLFGIPGTGKSYISKAIAKTFNWPLVMIEASQIFHRFVGASEQNLKNILTKVEMMSPIVVFIDEIDKLFSGIQSSHLSDAGTTAKVFGIFLTWMQEVKQKVFVVATANSIANLPPELKRKERWDQIFFVDLPDEEEAAEIIRIHLKKYKVNESKINIEELARSAVMKKLTGAEIESAIKEAVADHCVRLLNNEPSELTTKEFHKSILETKGIADDTEIKILKNEAMKIAINASSKKDKSVEQKILKDLQ